MNTTDTTPSHRRAPTCISRTGAEADTFAKCTSRRRTATVVTLIALSSFAWTLWASLTSPAGAQVAGPTVTINQADTQLDPTNGFFVHFTAVFSKPVTGFSASHIALTGSTAGNVSVTEVFGITSTVYDVKVGGMSNPGTVIANIEAGAAIDADSNLSAASTSTDNVVRFDRTAPTVTIEQAAGQADSTKTSPVQFTATFSEPVTGFAAEDIVFDTAGAAGGTLAAAISGAGPTYTVSVTGMTTSGLVRPSIKADAVLDLAGNSSMASSSIDNSVSWDVAAPTVTVEQVGTQDPTGTSPINFKATFSEPVTGFSGAGVAFPNPVAGWNLVANVTGSGATYNIAVTGMTTPGVLRVAIRAGSATDAAGNQNTASPTPSTTDDNVTWDPGAPSVTIARAAGQGSIDNTAPINFTVRFSKAVTGFTSSDVLFTNSTAPGALAAVITGSGSTYNVAVTGMTPRTVGVVRIAIPADAVVDDAANGNKASPPATNANSVTWDAQQPTVMIDQAVGQPDFDNSSPVNFTFKFSEPVLGFTAADVSFNGSNAGPLVAAITGSGSTYNVRVTGMTTDGPVQVSLPANTVTDAAGNGNIASPTGTMDIANQTVTWDRTAPTMFYIGPDTNQASSTNTSPINFAVNVSEAVTGLTAADITIQTTTGGTLSATVTGGPRFYNVAVKGMTTSGEVKLSIAGGKFSDLAGNLNVGRTADGSVTWDATAPTVNITRPPGQGDPAIESSIQLTATFSEQVTGFDASDVSITGTATGTKHVAVTMGTVNQTFFLEITGMTSGGTVAVSIPAGKAKDLAGNPNAASNAISVTWDPPPTVTLNQSPGQPDPAHAGSINFRATFSEPVTGFDEHDFLLTGTTAGGTPVIKVSGGPTQYSVAVSGFTTGGLVKLSIPANRVLGSNNGRNLASTSTDNTVTWDPVPTVVVSQAAGQADPTSSSPINFTVTFSEPVTGFDATDVSFANSTAGAALQAVVTGTGSAYNVAVSGMTVTGLVKVSVPAGKATDATGNLNQASTAADNSVTWRK